MLQQVNLKNVLVLDVETVPQYASAAEIPANLLELWAHKTRFMRKDGETPEEYYSKAGIFAEFGKIICISFGIYIKRQGKLSFRIKSIVGHEEKEILSAFIEILKKQPANVLLCAHNGKEFDFPYLCRRMLINNLEIPTCLQIAGKKPWEINHLDTMELWKFGDYKNYTSLHLLATIFGIPSPKDDMEGSDVHRVYWKDQDLKRIEIYCQKDVLTTAQLLLRFKGLPTITNEAVIIVT